MLADQSPNDNFRISAGAIELQKQMGIEREARLNYLLNSVRRITSVRGKLRVQRSTAQWLLDCAEYDLLRDRVFDIERMLHGIEIEVLN